jgi:hypothetical protein
MAATSVRHGHNCIDESQTVFELSRVQCALALQNFAFNGARSFRESSRHNLILRVGVLDGNSTREVRNMQGIYTKPRGDMSQELKAEDIDLILESLKYHKDRVENYKDYPSYEFKQQQMRRVESVIAKMRDLRDNLA